MKTTIKTVAVLLTAMSLTSCYDFNRHQDELDAQSQGKQILLKAESSKKAKIEEAKADFESAQLDAKTKVITANSNAEAKLIESQAKAKSIDIISKAISTNPDYIKYMMVEGMYNNNKTVYVPTEANIPIIERK
jgi:regulator of protease activity HflC (stomatin/prohibitin superfamily)